MGQAVALLLEGGGDRWAAVDLRRLRRALTDEYAGPDRVVAIQQIDKLLEVL